MNKKTCSTQGPVRSVTIVQPTDPDLDPKVAFIVSDSRFSSFALSHVLAEQYPVVEATAEVTPEIGTGLRGSSVILVDISAPDQLIRILEEIEILVGDLDRVVVLLRSDQDLEMLEDFIGKVAAVVPAQVPIENIAQIANAACADLSILPTAVVRALVEDSPKYGQARRDLLKLTKRERHILNLLATGQSNKKIADALKITDSTVRVHIRAIVQKLGASNRTQVALFAAGLQDLIRRGRCDS